MAPASPDSHQELLDTLDISGVPKPFRNPHWKPPQRRNKTIKQILSEVTRKEASLLATQNNSGSSTPLPASSVNSSTPNLSGPMQPSLALASQHLSRFVAEKSLQERASSGPAATYTNIESPPSLHPGRQKKFCDITGLPSAYTDPKTRLRYVNKEVFALVRTLPQGVAESYLEARGAHVVLK